MFIRNKHRTVYSGSIGMKTDEFIYEIRDVLAKNDVSVECISNVLKLIIADNFAKLDDVNNQYVKILHDVRNVLENDKLEDFYCIEKK